MSGGSFDYFYSRAPEELSGIAASLERMADECDRQSREPPKKHWKTGEMVEFAAMTEVAADVRGIAYTVRGIARMLEFREALTKEIEWWKSCDTGPVDVLERWTELKNGKKP